MIFKLVARDAWEEAVRAGEFGGSADDLRDGFIHFSAADQVAETAARHFKGAANLLLIAFIAEKLGPALRWEASRGGALFPHLYAPLPTSQALWVREIALDSEGVPVIPKGVLS